MVVTEWECSLGPCLNYTYGLASPMVKMNP